MNFFFFMYIHISFVSFNKKEINVIEMFCVDLNLKELIFLFGWQKLFHLFF